MSLSIGQVQALTTKGIVANGGVADLIFKANPLLKRLKENQGEYSGEKMTFPFNFLDDLNTTGSAYNGAETLTLDQYDPFSELSFDIVEFQETVVVTNRDLARNSGKNARLKLIEQRLKFAEMAMRQRLNKSVFSDGTAATGALSASQFQGTQTFMLASGVNYGGVLSSDVAVHAAFVASNAGTNRALTTSLHQAVLGGASEGTIAPSLAVMQQAIMNSLIELIKPYQRTTREGSLDGMGHSKMNTLVYGGIDHIVDAQATANAILFFNEDFFKLYSHPEYDMITISKDSLETMDATLNRIFWKGTLATNVLRYQGILKDVQ